MLLFNLIPDYTLLNLLRIISAISTILTNAINQDNNCSDIFEKLHSLKKKCQIMSLYVIQQE